MLLWLALTFHLAWAGLPTLSPTMAEFHNLCRAHRAPSAFVHVSSGIAIGQALYLPVPVLERSQSTFSFDRVVKGLRDLKRAGAFRRGKLHHDDGRSVYPKDRRITGVLYRGRVYIVDGHHRALISTYVGAKTIPVELIADWSAKPPSRFFRDLRSRHLSYFYDHGGSWAGPGEFCEIVDDPMIFFARKVLRRIDLNYDIETGELEIIKDRGAKVAIGLKLNRDVPFTEQEMARLFRKGGLEWERGDRVTAKLMARALEILRTRRTGSRLRQLLLLDRPTRMAQLDLEDVIRKHFQRVQCEFQLTSGDED